MTKSILCKKVISAIRSVTGKNNNIIGLHEPNISNLEKKFVKKCLDLNFISSKGMFVQQFEKKLKDITKSKNVIAVISGTAALHLALRAINLKRNEEVLIPALNYIASANSVIYCGGIPHFVDIEEESLGIDIEKLKIYLSKICSFKNGKTINKKTKRRIKAIIPMHVFGHPSKIKEIIKIAKDYKLDLIEDAAEALGSLYNDKHVGTFGKIGILSFNGNKTVSTGAGGAVLAQNNKIANRIKHLASICKIPHRWKYDYDEAGYNYNLPNLNAALGCAQLKRLKNFLKQKRALFMEYKKAFKNIKEVSILSEPKNCTSNYWLQTLILKFPNMQLRNDILDYSTKKKILTRPAWELMHCINYLKKFPRMNLENSEEMIKKIINLPSSSQLI